jgi:phosphoglycolate phosphatase
MEKLMFKGVRTIILDYDGTLHDSTRNYIQAFKRAYAYLVDTGHAAPKDWEDAQITKWLGYSSKAMWENFMPDLEEDVRSKASKMIGQILLEKAQTGQAVLYEGALETLQVLKEKGYRLQPGLYGSAPGKLRFGPLLRRHVLH